MRVFLTGGTGFIGNHVLKHIIAAGVDVIALRRAGSQHSIPLLHPSRWIEGNLENDWEKPLSECQILVHLAACGVSPQRASWGELFDINVRQSMCLWQLAARAGISRLVICGSCLEYGRSAERYDFIPTNAPLEPTNYYAASKAAATMAACALAMERNVELIVLRPFHVFGEGQFEENFWPSLRKAALAGNDFAMTAGDQIRDYVPVETVAEAFVSALVRNDLRPGEPKIQNVGTGIPQRLKDFAADWWKKLNASGKLKMGNIPYRHDEVMRYVPEIK